MESVSSCPCDPKSVRFALTTSYPSLLTGGQVRLVDAEGGVTEVQAASVRVGESGGVGQLADPVLARGSPEYIIARSCPKPIFFLPAENGGVVCVDKEI